MSRPYVRPFPKDWWLARRPYTLFMLREFTAVAAAAYAVLLLVMLYKFKQGAKEFNEFMDALQSPVSLVLHGVILIAVLYHTITWFNLTPKALVIRIGEERVPGALIAGVNYVVWVVASALLAWIILRG